MKPLSAMQQKVLRRLVDYQRATGTPPELSVLARELGIHYVSLKQHLEALANKGYLKFRSRGRGRSPLLELPAALSGIPLLGAVPAGPLSEALSQAEGYLALAGFSEDYFALRVHGDSMAELIQDGDVVLLRRGRPERSGEICAVRAFGSEATLKHLEWRSGELYTLRPHNPNHPSLTVHARELEIDGVYRGLVRGELLRALLRG